ncbi:type II secretion system GspH family protein [Eubacterium sp. MSJ-13]|nr:type II secretion system GspH family protein [Eubacterium sp. MSJ-13]
MKKRKEAGNKGFSLVELIIVIAIMAILVGIVGTQVIPYINKSKESKDLQIINSFSTAAVSSYSEKADELKSTTGEIIINVYAASQTEGADDNAKADAATLATEIKKKTYTDKAKVLGNEGKMKSSEGKKITDIRITINLTDRTVKTEAVGSNAFKAVEADL